MDEIVPATPPRVETKMQDEEISINVTADVNAPLRVEMQRQDGQASPGVEIPRAYSRKMSIAYLRHLCHRLAVETRGIGDELCDGWTYLHCLDTCFFFCFCHAITVCCRCYTSMLKMPDRIEKRTARTHKVVAFFAKNLSALWVSSLLVLFARWVLFRPIDVKPRLAASMVHELELQSPQLRFNITTYVLLHNGHSFYKFRYHHFAGSVLYADVKLGPAADDELPSFSQKPHESTLKRLPFAGRLRNASGMVEETFGRERQ